MRIYRCEVYGWPDDGTNVSWFPNKAQADRFLRKQQKERRENTGEERAFGPEGVEMVDIPTDNTGLIDWLNRNFSTDNG